MKKLIELLRKPHSKVAIVSDDGHVLTEVSTEQDLLEQMIIYRDEDEKEGWQEDTYTLDVYIGNHYVYSYHHCTSTSDVLVEELEKELTPVL